MPHRLTASPPHRVQGSPPHRLTASPPHRLTASPGPSWQWRKKKKITEGKADFLKFFLHKCKKRIFSTCQKNQPTKKPNQMNTQIETLRAHFTFPRFFRLAYRKVGGLRFVRIGRLSFSFSFCITK